MNYDELLARFDKDAVTWTDILSAFQALRAVVELHKPKMYEGRVSNYLICTGCYEEEGQNYDYPCPTIQAIQKGLE